MLELVSAITVTVALVYIAFVVARKKRRSKLIEAVGYKSTDFQKEKAELNTSDLSDFLQLPLKIRKGHSKDNGEVRFLLVDVTTIMARGPYSGPSQVTYFIVCTSQSKIPDFTLRAKRFLETSFELRGSTTLDDAGSVVLWGDDSAVEFLANRNPELVAMLRARTDLVIRGVKGQLIVWSSSGHVPNRQIQEYLRFLELHCHGLTR